MFVFVCRNAGYFIYEIHDPLKLFNSGKNKIPAKPFHTWNCKVVCFILLCMYCIYFVSELSIGKASVLNTVFPV